jgi:hypothetical protein
VRWRRATDRRCETRRKATNATKIERAGLAVSAAADAQQWSVLPYRYRHAYLAQAQCTLLGYWRDCKNAQCRRARRCLFPQPCYWDRKRAMPPAEWAKAEAACRPLRALLSLGSLKGSEGLWLF